MGFSASPTLDPGTKGSSYQVISSYKSQKWAGHLFVLVQHGKTSAHSGHPTTPPGAATSRMLSPRPNPGRLAPVKALDLSGIKIGSDTDMFFRYIYITICIYICLYIYTCTHIYIYIIHTYIYIIYVCIYIYSSMMWRILKHIYTDIFLYTDLKYIVTLDKVSNQVL